MPSQSIKRSALVAFPVASVQPSKNSEPRAPLLTAREASDFLNVPVSTLAVWRSTGRVQLPYVKVGGHVRYRREDIEHFLSKDHKVEAPVDRLDRPAGKKAPERSALPSRLEDYLEKHGALICERCDSEVTDSDEARIVSGLEVPALNDAHDWHCLCTACHQVLTRLQFHGEEPLA